MSEAMLESIFNLKIERAMTHRRISGNISLFDETLVSEMKKYYDAMSLWEGDYRSGAETYGYENEESIQYTLLYISDRWRCAFRLKWLIDLVEREKNNV